MYQELGSDVFAMVSFFEKDKIHVSDPAGLVEIKATGADRFQIDTVESSKVSTSHC